MSSSISGLFDLLTKKMSYDNQKQSVLSENVANADTPGYKQLELKSFSFGDALKNTGFSMTVTDPRDIVPASMAGANAKTVQSKDTQVTPSGNSVDLEGQMMEVSKTSVDYQTMTSIYRKMISMINIAVKGSSA
ncbi:MAG: flagellar basal body rod protein FlgB [Alphaproteobacteria bacterium]|nr:flagellar basal body rod protein FlgB [Alphaproteobacteria bacterium]